MERTPEFCILPVRKLRSLSFCNEVSYYGPVVSERDAFV